MTSRARLSIFLVITIALNTCLWAGSRYMRASWAGVPPVPTQKTALMMTLGDAELSFRMGAITLQNLGDGGGRVTPLKNYNYTKIGQWLWLLHSLNPASEHTPSIAAYYYGAERTPENVAVIVDYLYRIGQNPAGEKFRWLGDAVFLARHRMHDLDRALEIAMTLSQMKPLTYELPLWAHELPAFILQAQGKNTQARAIIENLLQTKTDLPPQEIQFMHTYLIERLGVDPAEVQGLSSKSH